jgi:hypothetical protein
MAELTKQLHFLKNGTEQTAKVYSTVEEAGDNYVNFKIDGVACYAPLGATDDSMATNGRAIKGGTTYAIKSQAKPAYAEISYTTAGTHTFTVPAGVNRVRVAVCGGGGGSAAGTIYNTNNHASATGGNGGASSFGDLISVNGGTGGKVVSKEYRWTDDEGYTWRDKIWDTANCAGGTGGSPNGKNGTFGDVWSSDYKGMSGCNTSAITLNGGGGFSLAFANTNNTSGYGKGTGLTVNPPANYMRHTMAASGGSGGYNTGYFDVTPNSTYTITVGAAGENKTNSLNGAVTYNNAQSGFVLIAYGGDI